MEWLFCNSRRALFQLEKQAGLLAVCIGAYGMWRGLGQGDAALAEMAVRMVARTGLFRTSVSAGNAGTI